MADKKFLICVIALVLSFAFICFCACGGGGVSDSINGFNELDSTEDVNSDESASDGDVSNPDKDAENENCSMKISIIVENKTFDAVLYDVKAAEEFYSMLPLTMDMSAMPHEKYFYLNRNLTSEPRKVENIEEGDMMLWGNNCFVLFYESFSSSYSYTKLGKLENTQGFADALGQAGVTVTVRRAQGGLVYTANS